MRDRQVLIGARNSAITEARFIPPPPGDQLDAGFRQSVDWINNPPEDLPPVVHAALSRMARQESANVADQTIDLVGVVLVVVSVSCLVA